VPGGNGRRKGSAPVAMGEGEWTPDFKKETGLKGGGKKKWPSKPKKKVPSGKSKGSKTGVAPCHHMRRNPGRGFSPLLKGNTRGKGHEKNHL